MYYKDLETGKIVELRTENGKVIRSDMDNEDAKLQVQIEIGEIEEQIKKGTKELKERKKRLKKILKTIKAQAGKYERVEAFKLEAEAVQLQKEINKKGGNARVRTAHHLSKDFKEGNIWLVEALIKKEVNRNGK